MNYFFSNYITLRSDPVAWVLIVLILYLFKKIAFLYHSFQLLIHLMNTILAWLILDKSSKIILNQSNENTDRLRYILISLITLIWALHSANTEAVLLATNWNANLTYTCFFIFILYEISRITKDKVKRSKSKLIVISVLFFASTFLTEYIYTLPMILFILIFSYTFKLNGSIKKSLSNSWNQTLPYTMGLCLFIYCLVFKSNSPLQNLFRSQDLNQMYVFVERNLWLVPQIFMHNLKLILFPVTLSTYQSNLVHLGNTLFNPYSVFCTILYLTFLFVPIILFIIFHKKSFAFIFPLAYVFYFTLFPFLHVVLPTYCLSADRYVYSTSFMFLFILFNIICKFATPESLKKITILGLCILLILTTRTIIRIKDWHEPHKFFQEAINLDKNPLYKAYKLIILAKYSGEEGNQALKKELLDKSLEESNKALKLFKALKKKYPKQPITLKLYGLGYATLILKSAFTATTVRSQYLKENPKDVLVFFEPYIKSKLHLASIDPLSLYASILAKDGQLENSKEVLEYGLKRFPFSPDLLLSLTNYHFTINDIDSAYHYLEKGYKYFPYDERFLERFVKYYEQKGDHIKEANFSYLLGLKMHYLESYQRAAKIYLDLNQISFANLALKKCIHLNNNDPLTLLLTSRYLDLTNRRSKILPLLNNAYAISQALRDKQDLKVTKSILISLINVYSHSGDVISAKKYLLELEKIKDLTQEDRLQIKELKSKMDNELR